MTGAHGSMQFRRSLTLRNECCAVRKVNPLARALAATTPGSPGCAGADPDPGGDTGGGRGPGPRGDHQGGAAGGLEPGRGVGVPERAGDRPAPALRAGYTSIGCAPCTRATRPGEQERAGRWWWEGNSTRSACSIHRSRGARARKVGEVRIHSAYYPVVLDLHERRCVVLGDTEIAIEKASASGRSVRRSSRCPARSSPVISRARFWRSMPRAIRKARAARARRRTVNGSSSTSSMSRSAATGSLRRWSAGARSKLRSPHQAKVHSSRARCASGLRRGSARNGARSSARRPRPSPFSSRRRRGPRAAAGLSTLVAVGENRQCRGPDERDAAQALALAIEQHARRSERAAPMGEVVLAGAGPGDPGLVTMATSAVLADADVVLHDALVDPGVFRLCGSRARIVDVGKRAGGHRSPRRRSTRR